jgi:hypothetical protein
MPGAACHYSFNVLGESNIPVSNGHATTVVNIWAVLKPHDDVPLAWIFKNGSGQFWMQANKQRASEVRRALPSRIASRIDYGSLTSNRSAPWRMPSLNAYNGDFAQVGAFLEGCFTNDLSTKYY